ncbi:MAG TPA: hypothetical protein VLJ13_05470, partial [Brevundimonas sp.]|nr:hypothetical protein [Brevundimonas sp.]
MKRLIPITSALMLALAVPSTALAQNGNGNGNGKGGGKSEESRGGGGGQERGGGNENRGRGGDDRGNGNGNGRGRGGDDNRQVRTEVRSMVRQDDDRGRDDRARGGDGRVEVRDLRRELERGDIRVSNDGRTVTVFRRDDDRGLIAGCPPGLAKKNNGCLPPGQERQLARAANADRYNWLWALGGQRDRSNYRYENGYLYQLSPQGSSLGWLPVLGGALAPGAIWPQQYQWQQTPDYYSQYYGLNDRYDYRYADGALYGVDPQTNTISQVVALLTGQNFNVGQQLPAGYDVYNVPYQYRNQYADSADSLYRYNDGYVYQVDPKT